MNNAKTLKNIQHVVTFFRWTSASQLTRRTIRFFSFFIADKSRKEKIRGNSSAIKTNTEEVVTYSQSYQGVLQLCVSVRDLAPRRWNMRSTARLVPIEWPDSTVIRLAILPDPCADTSSEEKSWKSLLTFFIMASMIMQECVLLGLTLSIPLTPCVRKWLWRPKHSA